MNRERVRAVLGVWMPMVIGLWIIATSVIFYVTADLSQRGPFGRNLESWRLVCSAGVFAIGGLLLLSTFGRFQKARAAGSEPIPPKAAHAPPPEANDDHPRTVK